MVRGSFNKPALSIAQKIELLKFRGLKIPSIEKTSKYLQHIGYFRMTGYFKYFQNKETDIFREGTTFETVLQHYIFDRKLRLLTLDAIEKIEVSIKSNISDYMCEKYGAFWYVDENNFGLEQQWKQNLYKGFCEKILMKKDRSEKESSAVFIKEYFRKYSEENLPSWMLFEDLTLGEVITLYKLLKTTDAKEISKVYGIYFYDLHLRLKLINNIRNISAHHGRLWNRRFVYRPRVQDSIFRGIFPTENIQGKIEVIPNFYVSYMIMSYLLGKINRNNTWIERIELLFEQFSKIDTFSMGFKKQRKKHFT